MVLMWEKIAGFPCLHNFNVHIPEYGSLGTRLPMHYTCSDTMMASLTHQCQARLCEYSYKRCWEPIYKTVVQDRTPTVSTLCTGLGDSYFIIIHLTWVNVWESMGKPFSCTQFIKSRIFYKKLCEKPYQYYKSCENPYQVLQVMHAASERAMKSKVRMIKSLSP